MREGAYLGWMKQGQTAMAAKKYADAVKAYDEALKVKPGDPAGIKGKQAALDAQKPVKPPIDPKEKKRQEDYKLAMDAAQAAIKAKNYAGAVNAYNEAVRLVPGDRAATTERASAQRLLDAETAAKREAAYANWMKQAPDGDGGEEVRRRGEGLRRGAEDQARRRGRRQGQASRRRGDEEAGNAAAPSAPPPVKPQAEYDKFMQQGATLEGQKKYADAVKAYEQAVKCGGERCEEEPGGELRSSSRRTWASADASMRRSATRRRRRPTRRR